MLLSPSAFSSPPVPASEPSSEPQAASVRPSAAAETIATPWRRKFLRWVLMGELLPCRWMVSWSKVGCGGSDRASGGGSSAVALPATEDGDQRPARGLADGAGEAVEEDREDHDGQAALDAERDVERGD